MGNLLLCKDGKCYLPKRYISDAISVDVDEDGYLILNYEFNRYTLSLDEVTSVFPPSSETPDDERLNGLIGLLTAEIYSCMENHHEEATLLNVEIRNCLLELQKLRQKVSNEKKEADNGTN